MKFLADSLSGVIRIEPEVFSDERGFFFETYREQEFVAAGIPAHFVQDNHSGSRRGVLRGLHYQIRQPQGKLVQAIVGEIFDVAVDLRKDSAGFGRWSGGRLSAEGRVQLWIPPGFAHGFYVLSPWSEVLYKTTDLYAPRWERTLLWNDLQIGIEWPLLDGQPPILSPKDAGGKPLGDAEVYERSP